MSNALKELESLERKFGHVFADRALLNQALTHRSFSSPHNERLEFLGDSVLNCAVAALIYARFPEMPEGELSRLRANLVNQSVLAEVANELGVGGLLRLGEGEVKTGGASRPSILADALEAMLGAVYLDDGFARASAVVEALFSGRVGDISEHAPSKDSKTALQEWCQSRRVGLPRYSVIRIEGEAHRQMFFVACEVAKPNAAESIKGEGHGNSRRIAEQEAARKVLDLLDLHVQAPESAADNETSRRRTRRAS
jgi:ribonuclease III